MEIAIPNRRSRFPIYAINGLCAGCGYRLHWLLFVSNLPSRSRRPRHDPVGINFESNTDEYEPEVGTILPQLRSCKSADDVRRMVDREFVRCV